MEKPSYKLVGAPCGHHGQYTFYKALRLTGSTEKIIAIGDFFFVRIWQDSELVSIGELQLLWTDRVSDQTLVSLRLYFLPENTPEGRGLHGEDEVLAINDKVVLRADDLISWMCGGAAWRWGLKAVWRGACAPPADPSVTAPLHSTKLDFSDVDKEKSAIEEDSNAPGVVVFSYPRYCRYRALLARLEGIQADWLRDSLVAALGGYAAPTNNTRILYCKDTFEYPELEGHEFVCNHLAPRLKGRPRGRRRRERERGERSGTESPPAADPPTPRRLSLRNGDKSDEEEEDRRIEESPEDRAFVHTLRQFYRERGDGVKISHSCKDFSLLSLYLWVVSRGGYEAVTRAQLWRHRPARARRHYERFLLAFEDHERKNGTVYKPNGKIDPDIIPTIEVTDSPLRPEITDKILRTPSPKPENLDTKATKSEFVTEFKPENLSDKFDKYKEDLKTAEELNKEFLESLNKEEKFVKISVKPVEKLVEPKVVKILEENSSDIGKDLSRSAFEAKLNTGDLLPLNGHAVLPATDLKSRPAGRSSLRAVRVKPTRPQNPPSSTPPNPLRPDSASSSPPLGSVTITTAPPVTNFGIHHPPVSQQSDDEIVEVPYKPKTPEIIDLDEYPESPQAVKKKKLDILKEGGLEVTPLPTPWQPINPMMNPPVMLHPAMQHQILTQAQLFQMYNIIPPNYSNGIQPPRVIQSSSAYGNQGPEKTVYGNPKDPFMPPPQVLHGAPVKPIRNIPQTQTPQDILDLTTKCPSPPPSKPAVEILKLPTSPKSTQNIPKNYTLIDGKAVVGSNLEITLVNKNQTPVKNRPPQKRSSNGKFISAKTPTSPKDYAPKFPSPSHSNTPKKNPINIPNYQLREDTPSTTNYQYKNHVSQVMELQKNVPNPAPAAFLDPYMALYSSLAGQMDPRQLAMYRDLMANQFRYPSLLNLGLSGTPTTKN